MCGSDDDRIQQCHRRCIGSTQCGRCNLCKQITVGKFRNRGGIAVGYAESGNSLFPRPYQRLDGFPQTPTEADSDQEIFLGQLSCLMQEIACTSDRRLRVKSNRSQNVCKEPRQGCGKIHAYNQNSTCSVDPVCQLDDSI